MLHRAPLTIPESELVFSFARSGGPGGQNVNKVETKVTVYFDFMSSRILTEQQKERLRRSREIQGRLDADGCIVVVCQEHRTQSLNRKGAIDKLHELIVLGLQRRKVRIPTRKTRASERERLEGKRGRSVVKASRRRVVDRGDG
jgi:ribosome-associated protein